MSKAVKTIVGIAAAIAIPFAAPMIAGSAALAGVTASIGMTATSALVGAGLGAVSSAVTGGDVGRGALMGAIGGGIGGYTSTPATATSSVPQSAITAANATADPIAALNASQGWTTADPTYLAAITPADQIAVMNAQQGWTTADPTYTQQAAQLPPQAGVDTSGLSGAMATPGSVPTTPLAQAGAATPAQPTARAGTGTGGTPMTYSEALRARVTSPEGLADMTLRAAGMLAGSAIAGDGLSDEEKELLRAQTEELRALQQTNRALFDQRLEQAQNLIGESKYFDPEYFGLQRARRVQVAGAKVKRAGLRGLTGTAREAESRRFDLATARETGTAFDQGYLTGVQGRLGTMQAGLNAMPGYMPYSTPALSAQMAGLDVGRRRARETQQDIGDLFGSLIGTSRSYSRGPGG